MKKTLSFLLCICILCSCMFVVANAANEKIQPLLAEKISQDNKAIISVDINLQIKFNKSEIEKYVRENYEGTDKDADLFLKYYREEVAKAISPQVQKFVDDNKEYLEKIKFLGDSVGLVIADVYAYNIDKIAQYETVTDINYWNDATEAANLSDDKIGIELAKKIAADNNTLIPICIDLQVEFNKSEIEKYVSENYEGTDKDADLFLKYYREEVAKSISPQVQKFVDDNKEYLEKIKFQGDSVGLVIADVYAYNIGKIAQNATVTGINYWDDTVQISEDELMYKQEFIKAFNAEDVPADEISYDELYYHKNLKNEVDWVLICAYIGDYSPAATSVTVDNITIESGNVFNPFEVGYGVYDVSEKKFYDIKDYQYEPNRLEELKTVLTELNIGVVKIEPTESSTDKPTDPVTTGPTEITTDNPTEPVTTEPTESSTDKPTEPLTTNPTEPSTDKPTEPAKTDPIVINPQPTENKPTTPAVVKSTVKKKANTVKVTVKTKTVIEKKLKTKKQIIRAITVKNAQGKVSYKLIKSGVSKKICKLVSINKKGTITIKKWKKAKVGTYKIKVRITAKGNSKYKTKTLTKTVKIKIK